VKHTQHETKFGKLQDLLVLKDKYKATMPTCIEMEIYAHVEDRISKKMSGVIDRKIRAATDKCVSVKNFG